MINLKLRKENASNCLAQRDFKSPDEIDHFYTT